MVQGAGSFLKNILVFPSLIFLWLILLYNKLFTGTKDSLIIYCWGHQIKIWPPKNSSVLLGIVLYFTSKLFCEVAILVSDS